MVKFHRIYGLYICSVGISASSELEYSEQAARLDRLSD